MKKIIVLLLLITAFYSCERDDICPASTPTTPHLYIKFFDVNETDEIKKITKLLIQGLDNDNNGLELYNYVSLADSIGLPLRTIDNDDDPLNGITTKFLLHKNYEIDDNDSILGNPDIISINYTTEDVYVSRACGYKTIFIDVEIELEVDVDNDNWIESIQKIEEPLIIVDETVSHVKITH